MYLFLCGLADWDRGDCECVVAGSWYGTRKGMYSTYNPIHLIHPPAAFTHRQFSHQRCSDRAVIQTYWLSSAVRFSYRVSGLSLEGAWVQSGKGMVWLTDKHKHTHTHKQAQAHTKKHTPIHTQRNKHKHNHTHRNIEKCTHRNSHKHRQTHAHTSIKTQTQRKAQARAKTHSKHLYFCPGVFTKKRFS